MDPITTASVLTALGGAVAGVIKDEVTKAIVAGLKQQVNPSVVKKALVTATDQADHQVPALFYSCEKQGRQGIAKFLNQYFSGAAKPELRKPFEQRVKPDVACLKLAFERALEEYSQKETVAVAALEDWLNVFAEVYFRQTDSALVFEVARADYCEQLRNAFDDVKFGGITVDSQDIGKAEKLADIFVMPDIRKEHNAYQQLQSDSINAQLLKAAQEAGGYRGEIPEGLDASSFGIFYDENDLSIITGEEKQKNLLDEQRHLSSWRKEQEKGKVVSAKELLKQNQRAVLLGAPGSGKTTLMSFWAVAAAIPPGRWDAGEEERLAGSPLGKGGVEAAGAAALAAAGSKSQNALAKIQSTTSPLSKQG